MAGYNSKTGASSWSDPHSAAAGGNDATAPPGHGDAATHRKNTVLNSRGSMICMVSSSNKQKWVMAKDPSSGKSYWYCEKTGESSWTDPNAATTSFAQPELQ